MSVSSDEEEEEKEFLKKKIKKQRSEVHALTRELKGLTQQGDDLRDIFAAEMTRSRSIPKRWFIVMLMHLVCYLNEWHAFRLPSQGLGGGGGGGLALPFFIVHLGMFLLYWRRFYLPEKRFTMPMSLWIFIMSWYFR